MSRTTWRRVAVAVVAGAMVVAAGTVANPALAAPAQPAGAGAASAVTPGLATTEQIRAMAAANGGEVFVIRPGGRSTQAAAGITCTAWLGQLYLSNSGAAISVDSYVYCDDWVDALSVRPQIYRSGNQVADALRNGVHTNIVFSTATVNA